jgi:predicted SnoaL-like aldol condensation-catalyzing enzyme
VEPGERDDSNAQPAGLQPSNRWRPGVTTQLAARNKQMVREIFEKIVNGGDAELAAEFYKEDYIQHNPNVAQGLAGLQDLIRQMHASSNPMRAEIKLMNAEDDMVWLLVEWSGGEIPEGAPRLAQTAEVFRVEDGKLAEHWDVLQFAGKKR